MSIVYGLSLCLSTYASKSKTLANTPWILDLDATDYMICEITLFTSITKQVSTLLHFLMATTLLLLI